MNKFSRLMTHSFNPSGRKASKNDMKRRKASNNLDTQGKDQYRAFKGEKELDNRRKVNFALPDLIP
jgi:hypothetical protein